MTTKIKYIFINGDVLEVEAEDSFAAYILMDRLREENSNRKHRRYNFSLDSMKFEDERFATQWGNPENHLITHEEYEALSEILEELYEIQVQANKEALLNLWGMQPFVVNILILIYTILYKI